MRCIIAIAALLAGCADGDWPAGEVCNQRFRIQFAGIEAQWDQPDCEAFDYDEDGWSARYDGDDRKNKYDEDAPFDGSLVGELSGCRIDDEYSNPYAIEYNETCVQHHWQEELDMLCTAWGAGERIPTFEYDEQEEFDIYCP